MNAAIISKADRTKSRKDWLVFAIKFLLSASLLTYVIVHADLWKVRDAMIDAKLGLLLLAFGLNFTGMFFTAYRWRGLLAAQGVNIPLRLLYQSVIVAGFFRQFLPSTIGGDAIRMIDSVRWGTAASVAATALVVDRLTGLVVLIFFAMGALAFSGPIVTNVSAMLVLVFAASAAVLGCVWLIFSPSAGVVRLGKALSDRLPSKVAGLANKIAEATRAYRGNHKALIRALVISLLLQINLVTFYFLIALALGFRIDYHVFYFIVPIAVFTMMLPISINGIGLREAIWNLLLGAFGITSAAALAFAWLEYGLFLLAGLVGGVISAIRK